MSTTSPTDPAGTWPALGARVAEYDRSSTVNIVTVERFTATQIIVTGSHLRYRRSNLTALNDNGAGYRLCPLTDPGVVEARARTAVERVTANAERSYRAAESARHGYGPGGYDRTISRDPATIAAAFRAVLVDIVAQATAALETLDDVDEHPRTAEAVLRQLAAALLSTGCDDQTSAAAGLAVAVRDGILRTAEAAEHLRGIRGPKVAVDAAQAAADRLDQLTGQA